MVGKSQRLLKLGFQVDLERNRQFYDHRSFFIKHDEK